MKLRIYPSELVIDSARGIPTDVADRMMEFHIMPVNQIRLAAGYGITASQHSGFRHKEYERLKKRAPEQTGRDWSRHTYEPHPEFDPEGKGATDWITVDPKNMPDFARRLWEKTNYARLCYYPNSGFIHADYKHEARGRRLFVYESGGWNQKTESEFLSRIK